MFADYVERTGNLAQENYAETSLLCIVSCGGMFQLEGCLIVEFDPQALVRPQS
jgi:hypothetical protein